MLVATNDNFIIYFAMFLFVFIDILSLLTFLHSIYVFIFFPYLDGNKIIKYSILFSINYLVKNILLLLLLLITIVIALLFLYLIPIVIVSLFLYVFLLLFYFDYKSYITKDNNMILTCENLLFKHKTKQKLL
jgi:hypothetical protein